MDITNKKIIITAGGTGGHIYPALAVAELLKEKGAIVTWVGTPNSMEAKLVPDYFNIQYIKSSGVRGKGLVRKLLFPFKLLSSTLKARSILKSTSADMVIGFGGYVSGPICLAAKLKRKPIIIHEQNAKMGLTNKVLSKLAYKICLAFEIDNLSSFFSKKQISRTAIVGNPIRTEILELNTQDKTFNKDRLNLLILGGSQGAKSINDIIPKLILESNNHDIDINVWHQTGQYTFLDTQDKYKTVPKANIKEISPYISDMANAYKWADLIICRAGALTVSECSVAGVPAIFIPLPTAVDDHQFYNAQALVNKDAGFCIRQDKVTLEQLIAIIKPLTESTDKLITLSKNAKQALRIDASEQILKCVTDTYNK